MGVNPLRRQLALRTYGGEVLQAAVSVPADGALAHGEEGVRFEVSLGGRALHPVDERQVERAAPSLPPRLLLTAAASLAGFLLQSQGPEAHPLAQVADLSEGTGNSLAGAAAIGAVPLHTARPGIAPEKVGEAPVVQRVREAVAGPLAEVAPPPVPGVGEKPQSKVLRVVTRAKAPRARREQGRGLFDGANESARR